MSRSKAVAGASFARHICREIERRGLGKLLTAKYILEGDRLRVGVPTPSGAIDCGLDYTPELGSVQRVIELVNTYTAAHAVKGPIKRAA